MWEDNRTLEEKLLDGISGVIFYQGLEDIVKRWRDLEKNEYGYISCPYGWNYGMTPEELGVYSEEGLRCYYQLQVIWMIAIERFGDCGTSPRFGWITDTEGFKNFVERILQDAIRAEEMEAEIEEHQPPERIKDDP